jgi:RNA polymerase-binding transcription factor DksA
MGISMAAAKKTASKKKAPAKKAPAKKAVAKKGPVKKAAAKKKPASTQPAAKKTAPKKQAAAKKTAASKAPAKKAPAKKAPAKKAPAKKAPAKKAPAKKVTATKPPAKKPAAKTTATPASAKRPTKKRATKKMSAKKSAASTSPLLSNEVPTVHEIPAPRGTSKDGISYTKDFDVKFLKSQRDELEARRAAEVKRATRLEDEAESLIEDGEMGDVQFDDEGGEGDTMVVQRDLDRLLSSQARQTVEEIDEALERITLGSYGYSAVSGLPIPRERLEALPETTVLAAEKVSGAGRR